MSAVAFDTLKFAQTLREKAKFTPEQAEGLSEAFAQASTDQLATKDDLERIRSEIGADTKATIAEVKADILKWMFGTIGFQTVIILGAVVALSRFGH